MSFLKKIVDSINNMKIRKKLILICVTVIFIPGLIVGVYLTNNMKDMVVERAINEARINTDRIRDRLTEVLQKATMVSDMLYFDKKLQDIVLTEFKDNWQVINTYSEYAAFNDYLRFYPEIESIRFYVNNQTMLDNSQFIKLTDEIRNSIWYKDAVEKDGRIVWQYKYDEINGQYCLSLGRAIKTQNNEVIGVLIINMSSRYLHSIIKDEPFATLAVVDEGKIVISSDNKLEGTSTYIVGTSSLNDGARSSITRLEYEGEQSIIITSTFPLEKTDSTFGIASIIPLIDIVSKANQKILVSLSIMGISLIISVVLIMLFSKLFSNRIILLRGEMRKVVNGDFNITKSIEGTDEIGELYADLNVMIESIQQLIHEVYEQKLQKEQLTNRQREVEFKMLASQINPHFLYNTLETIRMKAHINKQKEIAEIVKMLAVLMRRNLSVSDKMVSLASEIELVKNYLEIQRFRFGERIGYEINVLCNIDKYEVLPLLLQPVVENAVVHGLENKEGRGKITINVAETEHNLIISVIDDGVGIDEERLQAINDKLNNTNSGVKKSIGLSNVNQRIKLFYGENYSITIDSKVNLGTNVEICLPKSGEGLLNVQGTDS